ncbi:hypothetical protein HWD99_03670 [Microbacterium sp. C5A9]|uniref:hypothetical protein n=1 Tax=Microbacterium sp. C5A9 TaxID=2736663 RepID=UPI001F51B393|nr:hypothetical protein [Microbacterium sp. C5A9]MCI1017718.1 hypothetical protein [Microbacterium sp. C5A9]
MTMGRMGAADSRIKHYEIRLPYARSDTLAAAFPELEAVQIDPSTTLLSGPIRDQAELHGLLMRIAGMGLEITEVRQKP